MGCVAGMLRLRLSLPNTGMAVAIDLPDNPYDIHPRNKQDVARRLSNIAGARLWKRPSTTKVRRLSLPSKDGKIVITFDSDVRSVAAVTGFIIGDKDGRICPGTCPSHLAAHCRTGSSRIKESCRGTLRLGRLPRRQPVRRQRTSCCAILNRTMIFLRLNPDARVELNKRGEDSGGIFLFS